MNFAYTYDSRGNITSETRNSVTVSYEYDALNQLVRVNDPNDKTAGTSGTTWVYTYDRGGNILNKSAYGYTTSAVSSPVNQWSYAYEDTNWKDKLTKFNGATITYDAIGNPLSDGTWTYVWEKGRQLKSMHNAATGVTMEFKYNHKGIRTQKVKKVNSIIEETTDFIVSGKRIIVMTINDNTLHFTYDKVGAPVTVTYNRIIYSYIKNYQGDIVGITDPNGNIVVEYHYDAWGNTLCITGGLSDTVGIYNPFRYRSYFYDTEITLFYLESRYYSPQKARFLSKDTLFYQGNNIFSHNKYCYTRNNPVVFFDPNGKNAQQFDSFLGAFFDNGDAIRDVTEEVDNALHNELRESLGENGIEILLAKTLTPAFYLAPTIDFYKEVDHGADWDIKTSDSWDKTIGTSYPGKETKVKYHGIIMTPEQLGNFTYGILGYSYGYSRRVLLLGSVYAAGIPEDMSDVENECNDWTFIIAGYEYGKKFMLEYALSEGEKLGRSLFKRLIK